MGYFNDLQKDYRPSMDADRFASAGPDPSNISFSDNGMFAEQRGTFSTPRGMFMPNGSEQQGRAIVSAIKQKEPSVINPIAPPIRSPLSDDPVMMGKRGMWMNGDMSLSPFLQGSGLSLEKIKRGFGLL